MPADDRHRQAHSDPVFLVPGGFIAVTGQGPVDSNESSKTTFEAALSLVHGDPGWRQKSPQFPAYAAELLFNPPNAPTGARVRADVGFIAAVFADRRSARIRTKGTSRSGCGSAATTIPRSRWQSPRRAARLRQQPRRAHRGCQGEYGRACAARNGDRRHTHRPCTVRASAACPTCQRAVAAASSATTLLGSDVSQLSSEQIAWQLIDLAAMRHLFDNEAAQRMEFFRLSQQLKVKEQEVKQSQEAVAAYAGKPRRSAAAAHAAGSARGRAGPACGNDRPGSPRYPGALCPDRTDRRRQPPRQRSRPWTRSPGGWRHSTPRP